MNDLFSSVYESIYKPVGLADDLYSTDCYTVTGLSNIFCTLFLVFAFYYIINRPSFSRSGHWLVMLTLNFLINTFIFGYILPQNTLDIFGMDYGAAAWYFALVNGILSILLFIIFSFSIRWWSVNACGTPYPN